MNETKIIVECHVDVLHSDLINLSSEAGQKAKVCKLEGISQYETYMVRDREKVIRSRIATLSKECTFREEALPS